MSYEGYEEFICETGHYFTEDCYAPNPRKCIFCDSKIEWCNSVDQTNGIDEDIPQTMPAEIIYTIGDEWKVDKYGNKYVVDRMSFKPAENSRWRKYIYHEEIEV